MTDPDSALRHWFNPAYERAMSGLSSIDTGFLDSITRHPIETRNGSLLVKFDKRLSEYGDERLSMRISVSTQKGPSKVFAYDIQHSLAREDDKRVEERLLRLISQAYSAMDLPQREIPLKLHNQSEITTLIFKWRLEHDV